jgi:hypothetical protein
MGCILSALGTFLLLRRGYSPELLGVLIVGLVLVALGLVWRKPKNTESTPKDAD